MSTLMKSGLRIQGTPRIASSLISASQQQQKYSSAQMSASSHVLVASTFLKPLGSRVMPLLLSRRTSSNAAYTPTTQQFFNHDAAGNPPIVKYQGLVNSPRVKRLSSSPPPTESMSPMGWEAFLEEHAVVKFFLMSESAQQSAYLESSIIWGQIGSDLFQAFLFHFQKWRIARDSPKKKITNQSLVNDATATPKRPDEEMAALMDCNFMNALLFAGPFNMVSGQEEFLKIHLKHENSALPAPTRRPDSDQKRIC